MTVRGLTFDLKLLFLVVFAVVVPMLDYYDHRLTSTKAYDRFIIYFIVPTVLILLLFRESPADYGFKLGNELFVAG